ncbi:unnamed protein product [Menidia menidia]|uniref:(Atlantic silverside) hypothetical protein n=1 Tax=Menidia menidia TaxID=238744 RepID=A0A8S4BSG5_9TELE|nr:unnamed protein product [Menidia menidia]
MAERDEKNAVVYRSVSFKKLGSGGASRSADRPHRPDDSEAAGVALPPESGRADQSSLTRNVSVSRKVSKISATAAAVLPTADQKRASPAPVSSISPSIRQLTEKFSGGSAGTHGAWPGDGPAATRWSSTLPRARGSRRDGSSSRKSFHEDSGGGGGYFQDSDTPTAESLSDSKLPKLNSGTDSVSGSDSERKVERRIFVRLSADGNTGKKRYSQSNARVCDSRKTVSADEEDDVNTKGASPTCKPHRSYLTIHHSDFIPSHSDKWPCVTKIRQLFDEKQSQTLQRQNTETCEQIQAKCRGHVQELSCKESAPLPDGSEHWGSISANQTSGLSLRDKYTVGVQSRESHITKETFCGGMDYYAQADHFKYSDDEDADLETARVSERNVFSHSQRINSSLCRSRSPSAEVEGSHTASRATGLTSDPNPDLQPRATSSWSRSVSLDTSSCSSSLQQPAERERRDRQGVGLPRDSLHSLHSSSRAPAPTTTSSSSAPAPDKANTSSFSTVTPSSDKGAPKTVNSPLSPRCKLSSGDEEEVHTRRRGGGGSVRFEPSASVTCQGVDKGAAERGGGYLSRSKNGWWGARAIGRSSGSEEDSPTSLSPHCREAIRRRSLRKKKRVSGATTVAGRDDYNDHDGESENSDSDPAVTMDQSERQMQENAKGEFGGTIPRSHSAREPSSYSNRTRVQHWERISSPVMSTTLPGISRVSKVNIPAFVSGPGDSRCSRRYASTETLKEEDPSSCASRVFFGAEGSTGRTATSSMMSKAYHGNFTMYRSPSFGHGDNFSRAPVLVRSKIVPTVTSFSTVLCRDGGRSSGVLDGETVVLRKTAGGARVNSRDKNPMSMSNPDITSETMTLLSFLKSDLSDLKVRKTSEGDRCGAMEGSSTYKSSSAPHGGTLPPSGCRPSLKDLTATLRRAKSFTYSDKPTSVRRYLTGGTTKRSSSEQQLDLDDEKGGGRVILSDREVESDGGDFRLGRGQQMRDYGLEDDEEMMPTPLQERCAQEARQVIQDICQMCTREDDDDVSVRRNDDKEEKQEAEGSKDHTRGVDEAEFENTEDRDKHELRRENRERERSGQSMQLEELNGRSTECLENSKRQSKELESALLKGDSEESMLYDRTVDELSGHESSLTDEGIVTEPEMGPSDLSERLFLGSAGVNLGSRAARHVLCQPVTAWKQPAPHEVEGFKDEGEKRTESSLSCTDFSNEASIPGSLGLSVCMAETDNHSMEMTSAACINNVNTTSEGIHTNSAVSQGSAATAGGGGFETPATPSALRRRRKFSPSGNNNTGSDSSNGSHAEPSAAAVGTGESTVYRSLSDPMPQRRCSVTEEGNNNFSSVDSNLLGSLSVKGGGGGALEGSGAAALSEYKGSVASDLSVCSDVGLRDDGIRDYSGVIRNIVAEPGAMDRLMTDDHGNGKAPKKKSFSDPSRRSDDPSLSHNDPQFRGQSSSSQPISELDQSGQIPPSSSEPILSEQREERWEPETKPTPLHQVKMARSLSEGTSHSDNHDDEGNDANDQDGEEEVQKFNFDLKLAGVLTPRIIRRPTRKRPNRMTFFPHEDPFEPLELGSENQEQHSGQTKLTSSPPAPSSQVKPKITPKHVRHASEPATFIPISPPPQLQPLKEAECLAVGSVGGPPTMSKPPGDEAPSLEDVTQKYILELSTSERDTEAQGVRDGVQGSSSEGPGQTSTSGLTEPAAQRKGTEDAASASAPPRAKPRVVSSQFLFFL